MFRYTHSLVRKTLYVGVFLSLFLTQATGEAAVKPTKDLESAVKSGNKNILFEGKEKESFTVKSGVTITGTSPTKAVISGDIKLENGVTLSNVTVSGSEIPITIMKGANVTLSNVTVQSGVDAGIIALEGGGTLTIKNSRITKNRKGLFIMPGKNLVLSGNVVSNNREEGLDARTGTTGTISGNQFLGNGEGGAEIIGGSARLLIQGNTFARNKADGLTIQSYSGSGKSAGSVKINGNTFDSNGSFGLSCQSPSIGGADATFYRRTISAVDNIFRGNKNGVIDRECGGVVNRIVTEEKKEGGVTDKDSEEEALARAKGEFEEMVTALHEAEHEIELQLNRVEGRNYIPLFLKPALRLDEEERFVTAFTELDALREEITVFPRTEDADWEQSRQDTLLTSLRRKDVLLQSFERLKQRVIPKTLLILLF